MRFPVVKIFENRLEFDRVRADCKVAPFYVDTMYMTRPISVSDTGVCLLLFAAAMFLFASSRLFS